ncbi:DUF2281 domain-containing protein [Phormidium yuhuli AB48]|uniref:DUF2281 domain-containing protein n=1 Tax=Phormidium yuhuli AB48 TaxID=2940671 RepID=A0ABY5AR54_9CYAN|nr:DUF2281 domain-containing protein [Phormidium yuhuli]USR91699.1 DUF2281 domain-containing protein [Phormidium yuhuli AB48]
MTVKEKLLEKIEQLSEPELAKVLEFVTVHLEPQMGQTETENLKSSAAWKAYLQSEQEREEVYRRLANS